MKNVPNTNPVFICFFEEFKISKYKFKKVKHVIEGDDGLTYYDPAKTSFNAEIDYGVTCTITFNASVNSTYVSFHTNDRYYDSYFANQIGISEMMFKKIMNKMLQNVITNMTSLIEN